MPLQVDHEERRATISDAVVRLAGSRGLQGVTFREVAAEASMSVALVQHYVGTKRSLLLGALELVSNRMAQRFQVRISALGSDASATERLRAIAGSFIPDDDASRASMMLYLSVGVVGLTDPNLQGADTHRDAGLLLDLLTTTIAEGQLNGEISAGIAARSLAGLISNSIVGSAYAVLLKVQAPSEVQGSLDALLAVLQPAPS